MSKAKARKKPQPYFYEGPPLSKEEKEEETDDVYDTEERETMLDDDEITAAEEGFMEGQRTGTAKQKRNAQKRSQPR